MDMPTYILLKKQIAALMPSYKGTVATVADLPANAERGDMYVVTSEGNAHYFYNGTEYEVIDPDIATNAQIDGLFS